MSFRTAVTEIWPHNLRSQFGSSSRPQLRFTMSGKQRTPAQRQESSGKRPRTCSSQGGHISTMVPQEWSWPKRIDEFASGPYAECLGATDSTGTELTWSQLSRRSKIVAQNLRQRGFTATPMSAYRESKEEVVEAPRPIVVMMGHVVDCFVVHFGAVPRHRESQPGVSQMALPQKLNQG